MEGFKLNQETSKAEVFEDQLQLQSEELNHEVESLPTSVRGVLPRWRKFLTASILSLPFIASGCEREIRSTQKESGDKNQIMMKSEEISPDKQEIEIVNEEKIPEEKAQSSPNQNKEVVKFSVPDPAKWLELTAQERGNDYFIEVRGSIYKLTSLDMNKLHKFKTNLDQQNAFRDQLRDKSYDEKLAELKRRKPTEQKNIWADGVDQDTKDTMDEHSKKVHIANLEKHEKDLAELPEKKAKDEEYIGKLTKLAIEEEIQKLGERQ